MNIFAKKYIKSLVVYDKIDIMNTTSGDRIYIVTYDLTKNKNSRFLNVLIDSSLCCAHRNWFMNFIFIEKNVKTRKDYLFFLYHEIGHIVHHDLYRSNVRKHRTEMISKNILLNIECEKNADLYAFENTDIKITADQLCEYTVWAQEFVVRTLQPGVYESLKTQDRLNDFRKQLYDYFTNYVKTNMSARFE